MYQKKNIPFILKSLRLQNCKVNLKRLPHTKIIINTINAHSYNLAQQDSEFAEALLNGGALIPDGVGVVKAIKFLRGEKIERIAGWDLFVWEMNQIEQRAKGKEQRKRKIFFLGSSEVVLAKIKARSAVDYPNLEIHTYSPPYKSEFTEEENHTMIDAINAVQPDLLWIGMTAPKQEKWAYKYFEELKVNGHIGTIGAVFDFYAGTVVRAPLWWQNNGLEWLYRLLKEPRRMWRRYLIGNVKFIWYVLCEKFNVK